MKVNVMTCNNKRVQILSAFSGPSFARLRKGYVGIKGCSGNTLFGSVIRTQLSAQKQPVVKGAVGIIRKEDAFKQQALFPNVMRGFPPAGGPGERKCECICLENQTSRVTRAVIVDYLLARTSLLMLW